MRVIAGTYRSRPLTAPRGLATRPTSDRLRETLFNVLAPRIEGARLADLYAGSGAVGIEALSRSASGVCFVDNDPSALAAIRANLASLKIRSGYRIDSRSVSAMLRGFSGTPSQAQPEIQPFDLIFLDPPYQSASAYAKTLTVLGELAARILAPGGMVIAEHQCKEHQHKENQHKPVHALAESYGPLRRIRVLEQGDAALSFYRAE